MCIFLLAKSYPSYKVSPVAISCMETTQIPVLDLTTSYFECLYTC